MAEEKEHVSLENLGAGADHHIVLDGRMAFGLFPTDTAERNTMVKGYVVAYFRRFPDHDPHSMVDKKAFPDPGSRMDPW